MYPVWTCTKLLALVLTTLLGVVLAVDNVPNCRSPCQQCSAAFGFSVENCCKDEQILDNCNSCLENPLNCQGEDESELSNSDRLTKRSARFWKRSTSGNFWKRSPMDVDELAAEEEKRAKYFLGKRQKYFLGKRAKYFLGKRSEIDDDLENLYPEDSEEKRGAKYFLGKRPRQPFLGKRAKYFLGKRSDEQDDVWHSAENEFDHEDEKRAKYFLGKRAKYFLGKREDGDEEKRRSKYFLGKRYDDLDHDDMDMDKRQKYFLGKRSTDDAQKSV